MGVRGKMPFDADSDDPTLVFYDDTCEGCQAWVDWVRSRASEGLFRFEALGSEFAKKRFSESERAGFPDSVIVLTPDRKVLFKSDAMAEILRHLPWPWAAWAGLALFPRFIRDFAYDYFARHRLRRT
jgi:predicted DCC family thiol-disulfide oxidoreductase YuxK